MKTVVSRSSFGPGVTVISIPKIFQNGSPISFNAFCDVCKDGKIPIFGDRDESVGITEIFVKTVPAGITVEEVRI